MEKMHDIYRKEFKTLADKTAMIRYKSQKQLTIEEFRTPFEMKLSRENRWVKLAAVLPWDELAKIYHRALSIEHGRPSVEARRVIGALIIKHKEVMSDEKTIEEIQENVYQQYFLGLTQYQYEPVFEASLFVTIRKRIGVESFDAMVGELIRVANEPSGKAQKKTPVPPPSSGLQEQSITVQAATVSPSEVSGMSNSDAPTSAELQTNAGMLIVDMTVSPADIAYPTDMELLNTSREKTEALIDVIYKKSLDIEDSRSGIKPRTYRQKARKDYLVFAKKRKKSHKFIRKSLRKQLGYVGRNIKTIHTLLDGVGQALSYNEMRMLWIIQELYRQQKEMYEMKTHRLSDRIVSVAQPHVRPIVRGKASAPVEFGAQISAGIMNGYRRIERIVWDPYNESSDLTGQLERYKETYGHYPEIVLADKKYGTKENRALMRQHGIRYGGTPLGRPRKDGVRHDGLLPKEVVNKRNHVEGTFGTAKRSYGLDCIKARRSDTSSSWIAAIFFVMNLPLFLKSVGSSFLSLFEKALTRSFGRSLRPLLPLDLSLFYVS
jgi:Transposase domain (DUF772).